MRPSPGREFDKARPWVAWGGCRGAHGSPGRRSRWPEIVLGIGLLWVLYRVLLPPLLHSLTPHHEPAPDVGCASREKQVTLALLQYVCDFDDKMPAATRGSGATRYTWRLMLEPYGRNRELEFCPSHHIRDEMQWHAELGDPQEARGWSSYGANLVHHTPGVATSPFGGGVKLGTVADTAHTIAFAESGGGATLLGYGEGHCPRGELQAPWLEQTRHKGGANYAYLDGHVKWMKPEKAQCDAGGGKDRCPWSVE